MKQLLRPLAALEDGAVFLQEKPPNLFRANPLKILPEGRKTLKQIALDGGFVLSGLGDGAKALQSDDAAFFRLDIPLCPAVFPAQLQILSISPLRLLQLPPGAVQGPQPGKAK